jgi:hypothetical protein
MQRSELDAACRRSGAIAGRRSPREGGAELRKITRAVVAILAPREG